MNYASAALGSFGTWLSFACSARSAFWARAHSL